jgi:cysteinyl-tRNA synthetase
MSKSLGNSLVVADVVQRVRPQAVRYHLGSAHYRSELEWTEDGLTDADTAYGRIEGFLERAGELLGDARGVEVAIPPPFAEAMDDDLAVPRALGVLHDTVRAGNTALADGDKDSLLVAYGAVVAMTGVLGLAPSDFAAATDDARLRAVIDGLVPAMLEAREAARSRKDFDDADRIRDALGRSGVFIEDTPDGPRWRLA